MGLMHYGADEVDLTILYVAGLLAGLPVALLDLRSCPTTGPVGAWLRACRRMLSARPRGGGMLLAMGSQCLLTSSR
ncbi:MAG TPA: hypothetical protein VMW75_22050 [Thermoanaerobaculia bacterium]|nr:hypothetical protein [Thermoanaerobaculia bacterium]